MTLIQLKQELKKLADPKRAEVSAWFFKTGKGEYGYGDIFLGITVPEQRQVAKRHLDLSLIDIQKLLNSKIHEHRLVGLIILVYKFEKTEASQQKMIYSFYLKNAKKINNWDLVDTSAPGIVGKYLLNKPKSVLYDLAKSKNLWEKRIAIVATWTFIRKNDFKETFVISKILLSDSHDLIHKAVGWMLREVGKRDQKALETFLNANIKHVPRTTLRYAIERFPEKKRRIFLKKT